MNFIVKAALRSQGLNPEDPKVQLTLATAKSFHPTLQAASLQARSPEWLLRHARAVATTAQKRGLLDQGLSLADWADGAAKLASENPEVVVRLHSLRNLF